MIGCEVVKVYSDILNIVTELTSVTDRETDRRTEGTEQPSEP